jgi:UDP-glucose 4-epimerase|tara:strand:- start:1622 stop:2614 length:993 start_codon:yes stop_codon:yes gene_type:complete
MKIFVTGCAGLLGANYTRHLLANGHHVVGIDDLSGGYKAFVAKGENFEFKKFNLERRKKVVELFEEHNPDVLVHFAAYAAEGLSPFIRNYNYRNNLICSANLINECINHKTKMIFTSSMAVYGGQQTPFTEDKQPQPIDPYGVAKYAVECDLKMAREQFGLRYNIIRPHNVLGRYQNIWDRYRNVIGIFIRKTLNGEPILVYGDGEQTRAFSDIQYYMEPFDILLTEHDGEIFNIGADKFFSLNQVAETVQSIGKKYGYDVPIEHGPPRHEVKHAYCDHTKAKNLLKFQDNTKLEELIEDVFVWAMKQPKRKVKDMEYEVTDGIYEYWRT